MKRCWEWSEDLEKCQEEWCDYDWMAWAIRKTEYEPESSMEQLIACILMSYETELEEAEKASYLDIEDRRPYPMCLMVNTSDVMAYVRDSGGLKEFDDGVGIFKENHKDMEVTDEV